MESFSLAMETELENGIVIYSTPTPKENGVTCNVSSNGGSNLKANGVLSQLQNNLWPVSQSPTVNPTLGHHLARRLVQIGVSDIFSVPGDSNLTLLDYFVDEPGLKLIGCCNELNAGYAADGYARSRGVGACVVTFTVGSLSLINAIAGAYSDDLPVICIVGGPNSNDYGSQKILHHTVGSPDFSQELKCFQTVTCHQSVITELGEAQNEIDKAISMCLRHSKPVYISISCNLVSIPHHTFVDDPRPLFFPPKLSDGLALEMAVDAAAKLLNEAEKPVMVAGRKLRLGKAQKDFVALADACGYAVAVMPTAKGLFPENHPRFIGTYWGPLSTSYCSEVVEIADASLFAGAVFDEFETVGYSFHFKKTKSVIVEPERVIIPNKPVFDNVLMKDFLKALAKRLERNPTAYENYDRIFIPDGVPRRSSPQQALRVNVLFKHIQKLLLSSQMAVISETGDSWFQCQKLKLPEDCGYEMQLNYASIGWSVGATLGYAQATPHKRLLSCIGDGSFQMGPQEVSTMIRCGQRNIIFLINNGGYSIEVEIHDGPYNVIKNWDYTTLVNALHNGEGKCWTSRVRTEEELIAAIEQVMADKKECLCFIEAIVDRDDTSKELLKLGSMMAALGARPPSHFTQ